MRRLHTAKGRREAGQSIAEGPNALEALMAAPTEVACILATADDAVSAERASRGGIEFLTVSPEVLGSVSLTRTPRGPVAVFSIPEPASLRRTDQIVVHDVSDPGNVGTIIRTAVAFGWDVTLSGSTADPWSPKVVRSSAGGVFAARIGHLADIAELHALDVTTVATVVQGGARPGRRSSEPVAIIIGSEAAGLPDSMVEATDERWTIPMQEGTESLNAAIAAGILIFACSVGDPADRDPTM